MIINKIETILKKNKNLKKWLFVLVFVITILALMFSKLGTELYSAFTEFNFSVLWYASILYVFAISVATLNWYLIINCFAKEISWKEHVKIYLLTIASRRLPGTIWYVGGRIAMYKQINCNASIISVASGIELIIGLIAGLFLGILFIPMGLNLPPNSVYFLVFILIVLILCLHPKTIMYFLKKINRPLDYEIIYFDIVKWFLANVCLKFISGIMVGFITLGYEELSISKFLLIIGAWALSSALGSLAIFLPSNFGITEISFSGLLTTILPLSVSISIAVMVRILTTIFELIISGFVFLFFSKRDQSSSAFKSNDSQDSKKEVEK